MGSSNNSIKIHEHCRVAPPSSSATNLSLPLTFFDLIWLRFHPVERIFFYTLPTPQSQASIFFDKVVPKLKTSLSHTLKHFLPLAGSVVWPSDSHKPFLQFKIGDGVSLVLAQYDDDDDDALFDQFLDNSPRDAKESRKLVPHLESSDSVSSVISLQITLFPGKGFSIGITSHHAVLDGKSSTMFIKAWAYKCKSGEDEPLVPELEPLFDRELIKDPSGLESVFINNWAQFGSKMDPSDTSNGRSLKLMSFPIEETFVRATFDLTRVDLEKLRKRILSKWELVEETESDFGSSKPTTLSTFVISLSYVSVCICKAIHEAQNVKKFALGINVDCRARLEPPIPMNYFGNCVASHLVDTQQDDFIKEEGVVIVAKRIWSKIKMLDNKGGLDGVDSVFARFGAMLREGVKAMGVAGSNRFGVYKTDFGWGKPSKVEITSIDRGLNIGLAESKDGTGGVEVGLVLTKHVMDLFHAFFHAGLHSD